MVLAKLIAAAVSCLVVAVISIVGIIIVGSIQESACSNPDSLGCKSVSKVANNFYVGVENTSGFDASPIIAMGIIFSIVFGSGILAWFIFGRQGSE